MTVSDSSENSQGNEDLQDDRPARVKLSFLKKLGGIQWVGWLLVAVLLITLFWAVQSGSITWPINVAAQPERTLETSATANPLVEENILPISMDLLPAYSDSQQSDSLSILRKVDIHTVFPERPRLEISKYTVQEGDTLFGISEKFGLKPETILWGNWYTLGGDPHTLRTGQELNILPVNGVLHLWSDGEGLNGVAKFYGVTAEDIINWPTNNLDPDIDRASPPIEAGTALIIPNGRRTPPSWQMIQITRSDPAVAKVLGPGYCGAVSSGLIGDGVFGWPTTSQWISGYHFLAGVHEAIDIGGVIGASIFASDDGVIVYSGWNDWGYGYVIVIDHGNGWQTLYAHLSSISAGCGQSVSQGQVIGAMGCTGNCTGPHLHFEMRNEVWGRVNPISILP